MAGWPTQWWSLGHAKRCAPNGAQDRRAVTVRYSHPREHDLYLGTWRDRDAGRIRVTIDGDTYTFYIWACVPSGTRKVSLAIVNSGYTEYLAGPTQITLTTSWQRFKMAGTLASGQTGLWIVVRQYDANGYRLAELMAANNPSGWSGVLKVKTPAGITLGYILLYTNP